MKNKDCLQHVFLFLLLISVETYVVLIMLKCAEVLLNIKLLQKQCLLVFIDLLSVLLRIWE